jgi:hypothetical protein
MSIDQKGNSNLTLIPGGLDQQQDTDVEAASLDAEVVSDTVNQAAGVEEARAEIEAQVAEGLEVDLSASLGPSSFRDEMLSVSTDAFDQLASLARGVEHETSATPEEEMRLSIVNLSQVRSGLSEFLGNHISLAPDQDGFMRLNGRYQGADYMIEGTGVARPQDRELNLVALGAMRTADVMPIEGVKSAAAEMTFNDLDRAGFDSTAAASVSDQAVTMDMMRMLATAGRNHALDSVRELGGSAIDTIADNMAVKGDYRLN